MTGCACARRDAQYIVMNFELLIFRARCAQLTTCDMATFVGAEYTVLVGITVTDGIAKRRCHDEKYA